MTLISVSAASSLANTVASCIPAVASAFPLALNGKTTTVGLGTPSGNEVAAISASASSGRSAAERRCIRRDSTRAAAFLMRHSGGAERALPLRADVCTVEEDHAHVVGPEH